MARLFVRANSDYIHLANEAALNFERTDPFSFAIRGRRTETPAGGGYVLMAKRLIFAESNTTRGWYWAMEVDGGADRFNGIALVNNTATGGGSDGLRVRGGTVLADNTDYHLGVSYDGSSTAAGVELYVNGVAESKTIQQENLTATIQSSASALIGLQGRVGGTLGANGFEGPLAEALIYNVVLTPDEFAELAAGGLVTRGLIGWLPMWGVSSPEPDMLGTHDGTVSGAAAADHPSQVGWPLSETFFTSVVLAPPTEWFFLDSVAGDGWPVLQMGGTPPAEATIGTGWDVTGLAAGQFARMEYGVIRPPSTFSGTAQPSGGPDDTLKDGWRTATPLSGTIAAGDWLPSLPLIAVNGDGADVRVRVRVWRSVNADMSSPTEITSGAVVGSTITNLSGTQQISVGAVALPEVTLSNEYLMVQVALETV